MHNRIKDMVKEQDMDKISHEILLLKIDELKETLITLLDDLKNSTRPKVVSFGS